MRPLAPRRRTAVSTITLLLALGTAPAALGHGGTTLAEGGRDGVLILVQGADATTAAGRPAADVSTVLSGPGTGAGATVTYWIRPAGGKTFKVETERDGDTGTSHAEVSVAGRGDWREWDVSAVVDLSTGGRLRVTNASGNAPGPDPAATPEPEPEPTTSSSPDAAGSSPAVASASPTSPATTPDGAVDDVSGETDGAPSWALPSLAGLLIVGTGAVMVLRRVRRED